MKMSLLSSNIGVRELWSLLYNSNNGQVPLNLVTKLHAIELLINRRACDDPESQEFGASFHTQFDSQFAQTEIIPKLDSSCQTLVKNYQDHSNQTNEKDMLEIGIQTDQMQSELKYQELLQKVVESMAKQDQQNAKYTQKEKLLQDQIVELTEKVQALQSAQDSKEILQIVLNEQKKLSQDQLDSKSAMQMQIDDLKQKNESLQAQLEDANYNKELVQLQNSQLIEQANIVKQVEDQNIQTDSQQFQETGVQTYEPSLLQADELLETEPAMNESKSKDPLTTWQKLGPFTADQISKNNPLLHNDQMTFGENKYINAIYQGQMLNGKEHGIGRKVNSNNTIYVGQWVNGELKEGYGRVIYTNGAYYIGFYKNNRKHGQGEYFNKDGNSIEKGTYKDGKPVENV